MLLPDSRTDVKLETFLVTSRLVIMLRRANSKAFLSIISNELDCFELRLNFDPLNLPYFILFSSTLTYLV